MKTFQSFVSNVWVCLGVIVFAFVNDGFCDSTAKNLTCYQCEKKVNEECGPETLLPCPPISDRCVTHIAKDAQQGFRIKRECGLGPCGFDDASMMKGLGLDGCDRSRDEYFCLFCCRDDGCNKSKSGTLALNHHLLYFMIFVFYCTITINHFC